MSKYGEKDIITEEKFEIADSPNPKINKIQDAANESHHTKLSLKDEQDNEQN